MNKEKINVPELVFQITGNCHLFHTINALADGLFLQGD